MGLALILPSSQPKQNGTKSRRNIEKQPFIDTLRMARLYGESPINSLERLRQHFNIAAEGAHRAMSDVIVNIEVFKYSRQIVSNNRTAL